MISITKTRSIFKHMFVIIVANFGHKNPKPYYISIGLRIKQYNFTFNTLFYYKLNQVYSLLSQQYTENYLVPLY